MSPALQADSLPAEPQGNTGVGSLFLLQWNPLDPGIEPESPALQADSLPTELLEKIYQLSYELLGKFYGISYHFLVESSIFLFFFKTDLAIYGSLFYYIFRISCWIPFKNFC